MELNSCLATALSIEFDVSWNSSKLDVSAEIDTTFPRLEAISPTSLIHQIVVDKDKESAFYPTHLSASIGDVVLFTPVDPSDSIVQINPGLPCQAEKTLTAVNFSRLLFPYLVSTTTPIWFSYSLSQRDCSVKKGSEMIFYLNPSRRHLVNNSIAASSLAMQPTSSQVSGISWVGTASAIASCPLIRPTRTALWPTGLWAGNNSTWPTGTRSATSPPAPSSFFGRAAISEVPLGMLCSFVTYLIFATGVVL